MKIVLIIVLITTVIVLNILSYHIKEILKSKGFKVYAFMGHISDLIRFGKIIKNEEDYKKKSYYKRVLASLLILLIFLLASVFMLFFAYD